MTILLDPGMGQVRAILRDSPQADSAALAPQRAPKVSMCSSAVGSPMPPRGAGGRRAQAQEHTLAEDLLRIGIVRVGAWPRFGCCPPVARQQPSRENTDVETGISPVRILPADPVAGAVSGGCLRGGDADWVEEGRPEQGGVGREGRGHTAMRRTSARREAAGGAEAMTRLRRIRFSKFLES